MAESKVAAIRGFMADLIEYRQAVKADALAMLAKLDLATLSNADDLEQWMTEMITALADKHLMKNGTVRPQAARMVRRYVAGMVGRG